jgi:cytochrome P450
LYAETLRLYVANIVLRTPAHHAIKVRDWVVRPGDIMAMMSYPMHHDATKYNTGDAQEPHPLSEFWADRFLVPEECEGGSRMKFSLKGLDGSWIPYGGGSNICPGRHFAKQEMLLTAALLIGNFDIQLTGSSPKVDERFFGTGVLGVQGTQPCRIQRRE